MSAIENTNLVIDPEIEAVGRLGAVRAALQVLRQTTGLRTALVARVTPDSWTACAILDDAGFGLEAGQQLELSLTY